MQHSPRPVLSGPLHVAAHVAIVLVGWLLFAGFWWLVLQQGPHSLAPIVWLIGGTLVLVPVATLYWVLHNRGIYARKGPRRQVHVVETAYSTDWAGRQVHADFASLQRAARIVIDSDAADKHFHIDIAHPQRLEAA